jgi:copper chaperone CopZ
MHRRIASVILGLSLVVVIGVSEGVAQQPQTPENAIKVFIPNMHCESCAKKIRSRLFTVKGVSRVVTWLQHDLAVIEPVKGQSVSSKAIWDALEQGKFEVDRIETPQGVIAKKPEA